MDLSYKKAGVDIAGIRRSHDAMGSMIRATHGTGGASRVVHGFGHYAGIVRVPGGAHIATHTDGVGTKIMVAGMMKRYDTVGIDCIAMNVNDIICVGAAPVAFVDYIAANRNDKRILGSIMKGLVAGAREACVPIVGGETAIMPDLIAGSGFAFDLAGTVTGHVKQGSAILGKKISKGDVIVGVASTGLHSNGYTLARKVLLGRYSLQDSIRGTGRVGNMLLKPTRIYVQPVLEMIRKYNIHGLAHITGGSFTKLPRLKDTGYEIDALPTMPPIMKLIADQGVPEREMYRTFNMGVGFCVIAPADQTDGIRSVFKKHGMKSYDIGRIVSKKAVSVNSVKYNYHAT